MGERGPDISVIIVARPGESRLSRAIVSSLMQRGVSLEVCLVIDGPCDDSVALAQAFDDPRIRYATLDRPSGRGAARARALAMARGEFVTFVDADDWIVAGKLARQLEVLREGAFEAVSTSMWIVDREQRLRGVRRYALEGDGVGPSGLPPFPFAPMMVSRRRAEAVGFDPAHWQGEDREFLWRLLSSLRWAVLPDVLYVYDEYTSSSAQKTVTSLVQRVELAERHGSTLAKWGARLRAALFSPALRLLYGVGLGALDVRRRSSRPTGADRRGYAEALEALVEEIRRHLDRGRS